MNSMIRRSVLALAGVTALGTALAQDGLADRFTQFTKNSSWELVSNDLLDFDTHHPQGMVRFGDSLFLSSVEIIERTERYETPQDGYDRTAGVGRGWVFRLNLDGELQDSAELGEGDIYHPGGIDFDGQYLWVPVAEYRPDSESII